MPLAERLRGSGLKVTPQRMAIYSMLTNTTAHPTAEAVWEEIRRDFPAVSFNTVYTTLGTLEQFGLIRRLHIGGNISRYDANVTPHIHLHCDACGRLEDLHDEVSQNLESMGHHIGNNVGYLVNKAEFNLYGLCPSCRPHHQTNES